MHVSDRIHHVPQNGMPQNKIACFEKAIPSTVKLAPHVTLVFQFLIACFQMYCMYHILFIKLNEEVYIVTVYPC